MSSVTNQKKFIPAICCWDPDRGGIEHALRNIQIFVDNGADGVFLRSGNLHYLAVLDIYKAVRAVFPNLWIGIDFFDLVYDSSWSKLEYVVCNRAVGLNGLWLDAALPQKALDVPSTLKVFCSVDVVDDAYENTCMKIRNYNYVPIVVFHRDSFFKHDLLPLEIAQDVQVASTVAMYVNTIAGVTPFLKYVNVLILAEKGMVGFFAALETRGAESTFDCAKIQNAATLVHMS